MCVLGAGEKIEVGCELESVASIVEYLGVQRDLFIIFEMRGLGGGKYVDARFLLLSVRGFVRC